MLIDQLNRPSLSLVIIVSKSLASQIVTVLVDQANFAQIRNTKVD